MISFTVLYPYGADKKFDWDYYLAHHMEGLKKLLGGRLLHYHLEKGLSGVESGTPPAFFAILHVLVKGMEDVEVIGAALPQLVQDIPNYTDVEPIIQISEAIE